MADDTRVVQMQFDNKNFERNIAKSQNSLEKFKSSLNFDAVGKGLSKFGESIKNLAFDTLNNNIQKITDKFTGMGDAGEYAISRLRAGFESLLMQAEQFVKTMTLEQVNVGQNKYDALTRSVQTIVAGGTATEEKAYDVMERVMEYTNQTSHSFETMVAQISSLTSMGVPLGTAEKLMEGFANSATKAGADASHAAIAMQTYAKAMGSYLTKNEFDTLNLTARVVTKEWREGMIEAGLATGDLVKDQKGAIKTAKKYGKQMTVTADTIEQSFSKKWATKQVMKEFGKKYQFGESIDELKHPEEAADSFGKTAYLTGQRALTFADALNAVKEAISSGWMETFRTVFGDLTDAMNLFTGACNLVIDALSGLSETRNNILKSWRSVGGRDDLISLIFGEFEDADGQTMYEGAYGVINILQDIGNMISEAFWHTFMNLIPRDKQQEMLEAVNNQWRELGLDKPFENFEEMFNSDWFKEHGGREGMFGGMLMGITEDIKNFVQGVNDWFNELDPTTGMTRMQKIQVVLDAVGRTLAFFGEVGAGFLHFLEILGDDDHLGPSIKAVSDMLVNLGLAVTDAENDTSNAGGITTFFENLAEVLKPACDLINMVVGSITELIGAIVLGEQENQNVGNVITRFGDIFKKVFGVILNFATPIATFISDVSGIIGDLFKDGFTPEGIEEAKKRFSEAFGKLWEGLKAAAEPIIQEVGAFFTMLWNEVKTRVANYFNDPNSIGHKVLGVLKSIFGPIVEFLTPVWETIKNIFVGQDGKLHGPTLFDSLKALFMSEGVTNLFKKLKQLAADGGLYKLIMGALGVYSIWTITKTVKTIGEFFKDVGGNLKAGILGTSEWFSERIQGIAKGILMLTAAVAILGMMDTGSVIQGIVGLGVIMLEFVGFTKLMNSINAATIMQQAALTGAISIFAGAIALLVLALLPFALVSWEGFARMFAGLTLVLTEMIAFMWLTQNAIGIRTDRLTGFIGFAVSMGILISALTPFMIADWQTMLRGIAGMGLVMLELIGFMLLVTYLPIGTASLGRFTGFAASIAILMYSLIPFMVADWESMLRGVAGLGLVMLELIGVMLLVTYLPIGTASLGRFTGFAASIAILMMSLIPFLLTDWQGMLRAVAGLGIVLLELVGFMFLIKQINSFPDISLGSFTGFAASIAILMFSLIPLINTDWLGMLRAVVGLGIVLGELLAFMAILKTMSAYPDINLGGFIGFAASIAILTLAISKFAGMDWEGWARALGGLAVMLAELIGFMALAQTITFNAAAIGMVIAVCLSIGVMALLLSMAMNEVRNLKWEVITAFTAGMATVILALAGAIMLLSSVPLAAGIKGILLVGLGIAALLAVVALIGPMLIDSLGNSFANLSGKLEMISGLLKGFADRMGQVDEGNISKAEGIFDQLKRLLTKLTGWGKFTGDLNNFAYSMFVLGTGMEIFNTHVGSAATDIEGNAQAALKFIQDLSGCANDLDTISKMNIDNLVSSVAMLGGAMSIYAYGAKEISGMLMPGETPDESTVDSAIKILQAISTGLAEAGGFTIPENMPDEQRLSLFGASLAALATALIQFEQAGSGLGTGTETALGVLDFFRQLKERLISTEFKKNLAAAIGVFDKEDVKQDDLAAFGTNIEQLGLALSAFNNSVTILDEATGQRTPIDFSNAVSTLDSLVALEGKLGWDFGPVIKFFAGRKKDFTDLGGEIEALGTAMADFIEKLGGVDEYGNPKFDTAIFDEAIAVADKIAEYLNKLSEKMGRVGGLWNICVTAITGDTYDFTDLKQQMMDLATGIGSLGQLKVDDKLITVDETTGIFKAVDDIVAYLNALKEKMGKVGGVWPTVQRIAIGRDYNFTDLKQQLIDLGAGLNGLSVFKVEDLPSKEEMEKTFPMIDSILDYLNTLKAKMDPVGGLANDLNDFFSEGYDFDFTQLKKQLSALGDGLSSIANVTVDSEGKTLFNEEGRGAAIDTMDALIEYMQTLTGKLGRVGGLANFFKGLWEGKEADFQYLGGQLGFLGEGLGKFQAGITKNGDFDAAKVSSALGALDHLVSMMQTFSVLEQKMDAISESYGLSSYTMKDFVTHMWDSLYLMTNGTSEGGSVVDQLAAFIKEFDLALTELGGLENADIAGVFNQISDGIATLVTAARNMQNEDGTFVDFSGIGTQICNGIITGITAGQSGVIDAAVNMAVAAYEAAKGALDVNSPSRVFRSLGLSVGEGFEKGIADGEGIVSNEAATMADGAIDTATNAMAAFAALMAQDIDANPTITPVLDLSNVTAGAMAINDMLRQDYDMSLTADWNQYARGSVPTSDQGTSNYNAPDLAWLQASIEGLGSRIDAMGSKISSMQIVLDSGGLVGAVTDGVNKNLGNKTTYRRRRN